MLERRKGGGAPARLLLLSRTAGDWWDALYDNTDVQKVFGLDATRSDTRAVPETLEADARIALFHKSVDAFKPVLERTGSQPPAGAPSPEQLARIRADAGDYGRPLAVQMEALLHLYGNMPGPGGVPIGVLLDRVLRLELDHWRKVLGYPLADEARRTEIARGVAQTTLVQGAPTRELACALLKADPAYPARAADSTLWAAYASLARLYGTANGGLAALEPDLIGEHLVAATLDDKLVEVCLDWADGDDVKRRAVLTILNRATRADHGNRAVSAIARLEKVLMSQSTRVALDLVEVAIGSEGELLSLLPRAFPQMPTEALTAARTISKSNVQLGGELESLARTLSHFIASPPEDERRRRRSYSAWEDATAESLIRISERLMTSDCRVEAIRVSEQAVGMYFRLSQKRPDRFLPAAAKALTRMSNSFAEHGLRHVAFQLAEASVGIFNRINQSARI
jgi:hypothetical protein